MNILIVIIAFYCEIQQQVMEKCQNNEREYSGYVLNVILTSVLI